MPVQVTSRGRGRDGDGSQIGGWSRAPFDALNLGDHVGDDAAAVVANRRLLGDILGVPVQFMRQVHGSGVAVVRSPGPAPVADAMVTDVPGMALGVLVADCVPVMVTAPGVAAVAHAGRAGTVAGVVPAVLAALGELGADRAAMSVTLGPAICGGCYEVPATMRDEVDAVVPGSAVTTRRGTPGIDLRAGLVGQFTAAGVTDITVSGRCTAEDPNLFSYRRDGETGRFAGIAWVAV
jgi:YfiH family protein